MSELKKPTPEKYETLLDFLDREAAYERACKELAIEAIDKALIAYSHGEHHIMANIIDQVSIKIRESEK